MLIYVRNLSIDIMKHLGLFEHCHICL